MADTKKQNILYRGITGFVHSVDSLSTRVGKFAMYLVFVMMAILLYESVARLFFNRSQLWAVEMTQFVMAIYYTLGGAYVLLIGGHVRMDLLFHRWSPKNQALSDVITFAISIMYMGVLWYGGYKGLAYAIKYKQVSYSSWHPSMIPVKFLIQVGLTLMFLQMISELIKSIAQLTGREIK
ncbi:MAG: TRAP transporter small permease subunit [Spirochaetales bacterium]|nr:TRAP transporter small permease subunit [Spirochaetales bacterium]